MKLAAVVMMRLKCFLKSTHLCKLSVITRPFYLHNVRVHPNCKTVRQKKTNLGEQVVGDQFQSCTPDQTTACHQVGPVLRKFVRGGVVPYHPRVILHGNPTSGLPQLAQPSPLDVFSRKRLVAYTWYTTLPGNVKVFYYVWVPKRSVHLRTERHLPSGREGGGGGGVAACCCCY